MTVLTIEIPDEETSLVTQFIKRVGGSVKVASQKTKEDSRTIIGKVGKTAPHKIDSTKNPYDKEFVEKINFGEAERKAGKKGHKVDTKDLWK